MARPIRFSAASRPLIDESRPPLQWQMLQAGIGLRGGVSVTGPVQRLEFEVARHYRTITVTVLCRMDVPVQRSVDVHDYAYDIELPSVAAGRYLLRVRHSVIGAGGVGFGITVLEEEIEVLPEGSRLRPQHYPGIGRVVHRDLAPSGHSEN